VITGPLATAHVLPGPQYVFPELEPIRMPPILPGSVAILSPVMREIDPASVPPCEGLLVVDLQGFVRRPGVPSGTGSYKVNLAPLLGRADVVKATDHELEFLDDGSRCELDGTLLVITRGPAGALVRRGGIEQAVPGREVRVDNTIGAGDTFLAAFVYWLVRGESPAGAATRAARFTEDFLLEKARDDRA